MIVHSGLGDPFNDHTVRTDPVWFLLPGVLHNRVLVNHCGNQDQQGADQCCHAGHRNPRYLGHDMTSLKKSRSVAFRRPASHSSAYRAPAHATPIAYTTTMMVTIVSNISHRLLFNPQIMGPRHEQYDIPPSCMFPGDPAGVVVLTAGHQPADNMNVADQIPNIIHYPFSFICR